MATWGLLEWVRFSKLLCSSLSLLHLRTYKLIPNPLNQEPRVQDNYMSTPEELNDSVELIKQMMSIAQEHQRKLKMISDAPRVNRMELKETIQAYGRANEAVVRALTSLVMEVNSWREE